MRTLLISCFCFCMLTSPYMVKAQQGLSGPIAPLSPNAKIDGGNTKALVIVKTDTGNIKTNNLFLMMTDVEKIETPSKAQVSKLLGPIKEDIVMYYTIKNNVKLLRLPALLAKYNINSKYQNLPVYVDNILVTHPGPIIIADSFVKTVAIVNSRLYITTTNTPKKS